MRATNCRLAAEPGRECQANALPVLPLRVRVVESVWSDWLGACGQSGGEYVIRVVGSVWSEWWGVCGQSGRECVVGVVGSVW